ncbi:MAG: ribose-phosphate diphosphokinase [Methanobacteriota archaeon]|nr:MAG: ribose-phosphate diphosphokinase [Euryarchaeota archaeon]
MQRGDPAQDLHDGRVRRSLPERIRKLAAGYRGRETSDDSYIHIPYDAPGPSMKVVGGSASVPLARGIARELSVDFVDVAFEKHPGGFPDGERYVRLLGPVSGEHVVLVQTTHPSPMIVELFLLADAIRDTGARRLTAVVPYFGYGRQDKRFLDGEAVSAKTIAKHIAVDCNELLTMAIPANPEVLKTFPLPTREVSGMPAIGRYLKSAKVDVLLAPDQGALRLAKEASSVAGVPFDFLVKKRIDSYTVKIEPKALDVRGKSVGVVDDVISTGGTIATAAKELKAQGARRVIAACVHGLFVGPAEANLKICDEVIATDTVLSPHTKVSVAPEFAAAIRALR